MMMHPIALTGIAEMAAKKANSLIAIGRSN